MDEKFLHLIWQQQIFDKSSLQTTSGIELQILNQGTLNTDSGPDFFNARIKIDEQIWAGNIEIHIKTSDWYRHSHHLNPVYDNVILHIVYDNDLEEVVDSKGRRIPTFVLKIDKRLIDNYMRLIKNKGDIACSDYFCDIDKFYIKSWQNRLLIERLERKYSEIKKVLIDVQFSFEEAFYRILAKNFGFKTNSLPFELLAKSLPIKYLYKQKDNIGQIEALLFGQSGFLDILDCKDDYFKYLRREYDFSRLKYGLKSIDAYMWKFARLRPANFPTLRIAQFAAIIYKNENLFSNILGVKDVKEIRNFFDVEISEYWKNHYFFCKRSKKKRERIGGQSIDILLINTVVQLFFAYGIYKDKPEYTQRALELLEFLAAEKNSITKKWTDAGIKIENAFESQAMIELFSEYCKKGRCAECSIGAKIIIYEDY
jgi:hypothetical protein